MLSLGYPMYSDHILYLVNGWWNFCEPDIIYIKIIHHWNFQNCYLYLIYLTFDFTLKSMGRIHIIQVFFKEIIFSNKSLGRKLHTLSVYLSIN
jgi:hypothetical protein